MPIGVTQLVDERTENRPIAPEYWQDGTCAARPISSISCTKNVKLRTSYINSEFGIRNDELLALNSEWAIRNSGDFSRSALRDPPLRVADSAFPIPHSEFRIRNQPACTFSQYTCWRSPRRRRSSRKGSSVSLAEPL